MPRFHVSAEVLSTEPVRLRGPAFRHLHRVLRLGAGERVELFDGTGVIADAEITAVGPSWAELRILERREVTTESPLEVDLAVAEPRGVKLDWIVEKATELGVARILPFVSARTVHGRGASRARLERWKRIARSAAAQSGRSVVPEICEERSFDDVVALAAGVDLAVLFWEEGEERLDVRPTPRHVLVVTGAEGGFTPDEAHEAREAGFRIATLGPRILRAETAAITAVAVVQSLWGDLSPSRVT